MLRSILVKLESFQDYFVDDKQNILVNTVKHLQFYVRPTLLNICRWFGFGDPLVTCITINSCND